MKQDNWTCTLQELQQATSGRLRSSVVQEFHGVGTDTRQNLTDRLFIPLKGDSFDAHDFVDKAIAQGARVVMVHEWRDSWKPHLEEVSFIEVKDTLRGLQDLAHFWRRKHPFKVIGITGSNGKTSTKEFTATLLKRSLSVHASKGSFNNHWGVPLTILEAGADVHWLVLEMGMNHAGELTRLCEIAEPDFVAVTTVGRGHIGELGSEEAIAHAKEEIYATSPSALKIFNLDNQWTMAMEPKYAGQKLRFSQVNPSADVQLRTERLTWDGLELSGRIGTVTHRAWVKVIGRHNTVNLMCASAIALAVGIEPTQIWQELATIQDSSWGRNQMIKLKNGARVLFDAYNSNPDSLEALLKNIYEMEIQGRRFLVMGDMRELGSFSRDAHRTAGELAGQTGFEAIWYIGAHAEDFAAGLKSSGDATKFISSPDFVAKLAHEFLQNFKEGDLIAVKGSRGMYLERVVEAWPLAGPLGKKP